ncbi:MAG: pyridoxamine 5'-phosphate oxidase family protein [Polyangiales bacterium]
MTSPFHRGEEAVQTRVGVRDMAERIGGRMIRPSMPDQHRELFERLPYVIVGVLDASGEPFASMLFGVPGFVSSPDDRTLVIEARTSEGDPIGEGLHVSAPVGLLGIELETRRRNRANGVIVERTADRFVVRVDESFGNCPQYIQTREILGAVRRTDAAPSDERAILSPRAIELLRSADTLFIASASSEQRVDVSHRGGRPGFVKSEIAGDHTVLTMPDFSGNNLFMTLGNLEENPRAGMAVVDFASGALLSLTGTTETVWDGPEVAAFAGAERLLRFHVTRGRLLEGAIPFEWTGPGYARQLAATGRWSR